MGYMELSSSRPHDYSADGFNDWAFMTTHSWDEDPSGEWVLEVENTSEANNYGMESGGGGLLGSRLLTRCSRP